MNILALDTSSSACTVALESNGIVKTLHQVAEMQQGRLILPAIQQLLAEFNLTSRQLDAIAFGIGPGSFTGIRIASSVVQGLAYQANCALYPVSSLAVLAQTAFQTNGGETQIVALDAKMGKMYLAVYRFNNLGMMAPLVEDNAYLLQSLSSFDPKVDVDDDSFAVGNGWQEFPGILNKIFPIKPENIYADILPKADAILALARSEIMQKIASINPFQVLPKYFS